MIKSNDRISIETWDSSYHESELNSHMFIEDFYQNIIPYSSNSTSKKEGCSLVPASKSGEKVVTELVASLSQFEHHNLTQSIWDAIRFIANILVNEGVLIFELVKFIDHDNNSWYRLIRIRGHYKIKKDRIIQFVQANPVEGRNINTTIEIPIDKCIIINFPESLGGREGYQKWLSRFRTIANSDPYHNFLKNSLQDIPGYDASKHHKIHELELWSETRNFGWDHRNGGGRLFSNYYTVQRSLKFRKTQFILRDYIIIQLKSIVNHILELHEEKSRLQITGLMKIEVISQSILDFEAGKLKIEELSGLLYYK